MPVLAGCQPQPKESQDIGKIRESDGQGLSEAQDIVRRRADAEQGDAETQVIGQIRQAAEQGDARAQFHLGLMYYKGRWMEEDFGKAVKWLRQAAEQGYAEAQYHLSKMDDEGEKVRLDSQERLRWFNKAVEGRHPARLSFWKGTFYPMKAHSAQTDEEFVEGMKKAVQWVRKAAEQGHASAQYSLAQCYQDGHGVAQDYREAVEWYRKAAPASTHWGSNQIGFYLRCRQGSAAGLR